MFATRKLQVVVARIILCFHLGDNSPTVAASVDYLRQHAGLGQEFLPAKQYRMHLHVATDNAAHWQRDSGQRLLTGSDSRCPVQPLVRRLEIIAPATDATFVVDWKESRA